MARQVDRYDPAHGSKFVLVEHPGFQITPKAVKQDDRFENANLAVLEKNPVMPCKPGSLPMF